MLNSNALITLEEYKTFNSIDLLDTSKDPIFEIYINAISNKIEKMIGRTILAKDYVEKYKGTNSCELVLRNFPVNEIKSIKFIDNGQEYEELDQYEYDLEAEEGVLYRDLGWSLEGYSSLMCRRIDFSRKYIRVEYNAGFTEVPADLKLICMQIMNDLYGIDNSEGGTLKSYAISDIKLEFRDEIKFSDMQLKTIMSYRSVKF